MDEEEPKAKSMMAEAEAKLPELLAFLHKEFSRPSIAVAAGIMALRTICVTEGLPPLERYVENIVVSRVVAIPVPSGKDRAS